MIVKLLTEHHLEKDAAEARSRLHLSKYQIVGNLMSRLINGDTNIQMVILQVLFNILSISLLQVWLFRDAKTVVISVD